jgi:Ni/Fe-hydrogenase 1 B-type cytochrome subunit
MGRPTYERVYIWEWPVRMYHWTTVGSIVVLVATGLLIGRPLALMTAGDASSRFWFGWTRFLHFTAAYTFAFAFLMRLYWMVKGNRYSRWTAFIPPSGERIRRHLAGMAKVLRHDLLQIERQPIDFVGHNPLSATMYLALFLLTIFQISTGFAMYAQMSGSWLPQMFAWIVPLMGGDAEVRFWHHLAMWPFIAFTLGHVYLTVFHDVVEAHGEISSIVSGSRFVEHR